MQKQNKNTEIYETCFVALVWCFVATNSIPLLDA